MYSQLNVIALQVITNLVQYSQAYNYMYSNKLIVWLLQELQFSLQNDFGSFFNRSMHDLNQFLFLTFHSACTCSGVRVLFDVMNSVSV